VALGAGLRQKVLHVDGVTHATGAEGIHHGEVGLVYCQLLSICVASLALVEQVFAWVVFLKHGGGGGALRDVGPHHVAYLAYSDFVAD
jgi:hypothetical protein